jgi:hypothetical protein
MGLAALAEPNDDWAGMVKEYEKLTVSGTVSVAQLTVVPSTYLARMVTEFALFEPEPVKTTSIVLSHDVSGSWRVALFAFTPNLTV